MDPGETREGVVSKWDDARGFGYITPTAGGREVFAHIRAWPRGSGRPKLGDVVTFEMERAPDGRIRARSVRRPFEVPRPALASKTGTAVASYLSLAGFVVLYFVLGTLWPVSPWFVMLYVVVSLVTFIAYAQDKAAARSGRWRTSEKALHLLAFLGGWPGAIVAQRLLHHKNRKASFQGMFWFTVVANLGAFVLASNPRFIAALSRLIETAG